MLPKLKFFLYARKSTDEKDRQVLSLEAQTHEWRDISKREHLALSETLEESRTAKEPGRPVFNEMLNRIERGEANAILCWDIDRLYRNPIDEGRVRWLLQNGTIACIRTPTRQFLPEDAGLLMGVEGGRATDFIIRLSKNVKRGIQAKLRRGEWPAGRRAVGYVYDHARRNIVPDPKESKVVEAAYREFATGGRGLAWMSENLAEQGVTNSNGNPWSKSQVYAFLTNPLYIGIMEWNGETFEGKYKPIIEPRLFQTVQKVLKDRSKPRKIRNGHNFPLCLLRPSDARGKPGTGGGIRLTRGYHPCWK